MLRILAVALVLCAVAVLAIAQQSSSDERGFQPAIGTDPAHEFPGDLEWINSAPLTLEDLRGKVVLLDFLTYGCINCIHVIPDLHELEQMYPDELVVIGVHSAKFDNESESENIRRFAQRYEITHPLVNDDEFEIWNSYRIRAWPSFVLIDPEGRIVEQHAGEGVREALGASIANLVRTFEERELLDRSPLEAMIATEPAPASPLRFPGNLLVDSAGERLFIADTNHHRIVITSPTGSVLQVVGSGREGFEDGAAPLARFRRPQGMALSDDDVLYVADSGNHSIRAIDLDAGIVTTIAGTGEQEYMWGLQQARASIAGLNSPWDLHYRSGQLYIAMAGQHQLWRLDLALDLLILHAGSGYEALIDGPLRQAGLNQPTGLAGDGERLYFADSEASAVRSAPTGLTGEVTTLVGTGLFDFGDVDGSGDRVRLQHPADVAFANGYVYVSDSYNHKIKRIDPSTTETVTVFGTGEAGWSDGEQGQFFEPGGLAVLGHELFIADTNNHAIRIADLRTGEVDTLELSDEQGLLRQGAEEFRGETITLDPQVLTAGEGELRLEVELPSGYKVNTLAPFSVSWQVDGEAIVIAPNDRRKVVANPEFPLIVTVPAQFKGGEAEIVATVDTYYCREGAEALCLIDMVQLLVPVTVAQTGGADALVVRRTPPVIGAR